jgi:outer membrane murein-binding lipoprotein Lpp
MENVGTAITIAVGLVVLLGAVVSVVVFVRGAYGKARMEALRQDNEDLRNRLDDADDKFAAYKEGAETAVKELTTRVKTCEDENKMLKEMAFQRANVEELITQVKALAKQVMEHDKKAQDVWVKSLGILEKLEHSHDA